MGDFDPSLFFWFAVEKAKYKREAIFLIYYWTTESCGFRNSSFATKISWLLNHWVGILPFEMSWDESFFITIFKFIIGIYRIVMFIRIWFNIRIWNQLFSYTRILTRRYNFSEIFIFHNRSRQLAHIIGGTQILYILQPMRWIKWSMQKTNVLAIQIHFPYKILYEIQMIVELKCCDGLAIEKELLLVEDLAEVLC